MRPENTTNNRIKFTALHIGEYVTAPDPKGEFETRTGVLTGVNGYNEAEIQFIENGNAWEHPEYVHIDKVRMLLKPLSQISDKDATEAVYMHWPDKRGQTVDVKWAKFIADTIVIGRDVADFLRSRGYALPFRGLSVDDLIEYGWIKLREVEK